MRRAVLAVVLLAACSTSSGRKTSLHEGPTTSATAPAATETAPGSSTSAMATSTTRARAAAPPVTGAGNTAASPSLRTSADWPTYHRTPDRAGEAATGRPRSLTKKWQATLDGAVYGQPLLVDGLLIAATENDTVYALDPGSGVERWHARLGTPMAQHDLPCGDIDPLGITSTPVFDQVTNTIYVVTETTGGVHTLVGLDGPSGQTVSTQNLDVTNRDRVAEQQRAALALGNGRVYVAFGGLYGDCGNYVGYVVSSKGDRWEVPAQREGGIWAPSGPAIDQQGNVYLSIGNGAATKGAYDGSDAVMKLTAELQPTQRFTPPSWAQDNASDADLGSTGPLLVNGDVLVAGKNGTLYILDAGDLHLKKSITGCTGFGGMAADGTQAFVPCDEGVTRVDTTSQRSVWTAHVAGSPVVGGGAVWVATGGALTALDEASGAVVTQTGIPPTTRFASPTIVGQTVYVGTTGGVVAITSVTS